MPSDFRLRFDNPDPVGILASERFRLPCLSVSEVTMMRAQRDGPATPQALVTQHAHHIILGTHVWHQFHGVMLRELMTDRTGFDIQSPVDRIVVPFVHFKDEFAGTRRAGIPGGRDHGF